MFSLLSWSPQVLNTLGVFGDSLQLSLSTALYICGFGLFYYILSITFFFLWLGPRLRDWWGKDKTLRFWEFYVSVGWQARVQANSTQIRWFIHWQVQTLGFWVLTLCPPMFVDELSPVPESLTTCVGVALLVLGVGSKNGAVYGPGYNTYYWYDMVLDIPNAYFSQVSCILIYLPSNKIA